MKVKIFNDLAIYKKVREEVLSGEDFYKIAEKYSDEEKFAVEGIMKLMTVGYPQNKADVDIKDFRKFFAEVRAGKFIICEGETAVEAVEKILLEVVGKKLLINILGEENELGMVDIAEATEKLAEVAEDIIFGVTAEKSFADKIFVVMVMEEI